jgi:hypothetical protein
MAASLSSALSSMEVMLDALMQRGIGKPEEASSKPKEEEPPPALPSRPTWRGRLPALHRPGGTAAAPWIHRPSPVPQPTQVCHELTIPPFFFLLKHHRRLEKMVWKEIY